MTEGGIAYVYNDTDSNRKMQRGNARYGYW